MESRGPWAVESRDSHASLILLQWAKSVRAGSGMGGTKVVAPHSLRAGLSSLKALGGSLGPWRQWRTKCDRKSKKTSALRRFGYSSKSGDGSSRSSWRQVHSEGEDETRESTVMKIKRLSLKKLKTWR
ncbi:hypothetical protein AVEN_208534-1 [Araneus ventricosus]|uniref:Uncharacterized protein n=1 Tax=Araneus ventricosus TaxID=182803 RepID=A0A4Y2NUN5_ARAVE|nr:hypothetical protein AVEN_208534-1 [Araneus ventricosus]